MKKYELDGRLCLDKEDFCLRLIALLHFPDYCGHNLDALYDILTASGSGSQGAALPSQVLSSEKAT